MKAGSKKFGAADLAALFAGATKVVVSRGAKFAAVDLKAAPPGSAGFAATVLGPTGNLRAPTARVGRAWLVGFSEEAWQATLAG